MPEDAPPEETKAQRIELLIIAALCVVLLGMLGVLWLRQRGIFRAEVIVEHHPDLAVEKPIELNSAPWWELTQIRGIGEVRAKEIVKQRELRKGFDSIDELGEIRGITPEILERIRGRVRIEPRQARP